MLLPTPTVILQAVFCSSKLIDALITFGAQNYLEFKLMQGRQASPWAAHLHAAVTACFLDSTCMVWLAFSWPKPLQIHFGGQGLLPRPCPSSGKAITASSNVPGRRPLHPFPSPHKAGC